VITVVGDGAVIMLPKMQSVVGSDCVKVVMMVCSRWNVQMQEQVDPRSRCDMSISNLVERGGEILSSSSHADGWLAILSGDGVICCKL